MFPVCVTRATLVRFVFGKWSDLQFLLYKKALSGGSQSFSASVSWLGGYSTVKIVKSLISLLGDFHI